LNIVLRDIEFGPLILFTLFSIKDVRYEISGSYVDKWNIQSKVLEKGLLYQEGNPFPKMQTLHLHNTDIGIQGAKLLFEAMASSSALRNLWSLHLEQNKLLDEGVQSLASPLKQHVFPKLRLMNLAGNGFRSIEALATQPYRLPSLRVLDLSHNSSLGLKGLRDLAAAFNYGFLANLQELRLQYNGIDDKGAGVGATVNAGYASNLQKLNLKYNRIFAEWAQKLVAALHRGAFPALQGMDLRENLPPCEGKAQTPSSKLSELLEEGSFKLNLTSLGIGSVYSGLEEAEALADLLKRGSFTNLRMLQILAGEALDGNLKALAAAFNGNSLPHLKQLEFCKTEAFGEEGANAVAAMQLPSLKTLDLGTLEIEERGAKILVRALEVNFLALQTLQSDSKALKKLLRDKDYPDYAGGDLKPGKGPTDRGIVYMMTSPIVLAVEIGRWGGSLSRLWSRYQTSYGLDLEYETAESKDNGTLEKLVHEKLEDMGFRLYPKAELFKKDEQGKCDVGRDSLLVC
jgi:Leucine-rich repeat (LRR) protein